MALHCVPPREHPAPNNKIRERRERELEEVGGGRCPSRSGWEITLSCVINGSVSAIPAVSSRQVEFPARIHTRARARAHTPTHTDTGTHRVTSAACIVFLRRAQARRSAFDKRRPRAAIKRDASRWRGVVYPPGSPSPPLPPSRPLQPPGVPLPNIRRCRQPAYRFRVFHFAGPASRTRSVIVCR